MTKFSHNESQIDIYLIKLSAKVKSFQQKQEVNFFLTLFCIFYVIF